MTMQQRKEQELLALVKEFPGLATRQYWLKLGLSETAQPTVRARLFSLERQGKLWCEETLRGEQVHSRCWYPVGE